MSSSTKSSSSKLDTTILKLLANALGSTLHMSVKLITSVISHNNGTLNCTNRLTEVLLCGLIIPSLPYVGGPWYSQPLLTTSSLAFVSHVGLR